MRLLETLKHVDLGREIRNPVDLSDLQGRKMPAILVRFAGDAPLFIALGTTMAARRHPSRRSRRSRICTYRANDIGANKSTGELNAID